MDTNVFGYGMAIDIAVLLLSVILIIGTIIFFRVKSSNKKFIETLIIDPRITEHTYGDYTVLEINNLLTKDECKDLIEFGKNKGLQESNVLSYESSTGTQVNNKYRDSKTVWLGDEEHPIAKQLSEYSEKITGIPIENQETLQIAYYQPNGKFNEHYDACAYDDKEYCERMNNHAGQRRSTLLVYLNDDYEGGETEFVDIGLKIKPETGKAILFWNTDDNENILLKSKHRGNPVLNGEKWICTKWSHARKYNKY